MTYQETLDFLFSQIPNYHKAGPGAYKPGLENILGLCELVGHPQKDLNFVHVGGTNGKGSVSSMVASICKESGLRVGLFTSPHLIDFRERIRVDGQSIPEAHVVEFVERYHQDFLNQQASFFEWTFAMALDYFRSEQVDVAVIEVGLGGRLDATNIITPLVSVITSIGHDHAAFLGDTLEQIAREKAGIIKPSVPVVVGETIPDELVLEVIGARVEELGAQINRFDDAPPSTDLRGDWQRVNAGTAVMTAMVLGDHFPQITRESIEKGLSRVAVNSGLRGRWETLSENPRIICDIGHNEESLEWIVRALSLETSDKLRLVVGFMKDKDVHKMIELLPMEAEYYAVAPPHDRALSAEMLETALSRTGRLCRHIGDCKSGLKKALDQSSPDDLIFVGGSAFVVADILEDY